MSVAIAALPARAGLTRPLVNRPAKSAQNPVGASKIEQVICAQQAYCQASHLLSSTPPVLDEVAQMGFRHWSRRQAALLATMTIVGLLSVGGAPPLAQAETKTARPPPGGSPPG